MVLLFQIPNDRTNLQTNYIMESHCLSWPSWVLMILKPNVNKMNNKNCGYTINHTAFFFFYVATQVLCRVLDEMTEMPGISSNLSFFALCFPDHFQLVCLLKEFVKEDLQLQGPHLVLIRSFNLTFICCWNTKAWSLNLN